MKRISLMVKRRGIFTFGLLFLGIILCIPLFGEDSKNEPDYLKRLSYWLEQAKYAEKWLYIDMNGNVLDEKKFENVYGSFDSGYVKVYKNGKWGLCDTAGKIIIEPKFDDIESFREGLARIKIGDKYGFVDMSGKIVIEPKFDAATYFSEGLAGVLIGNKCGFIDKTGRLVIETKFDEVYNFRETLALVRIDTLYGFIDRNGEWVIKPVYDDCYYFSEGLAAVKKKDKWGYIDKEGRVVIDFKFDNAYPFSENRALVLMDQKYFFVNKEGKPVIETQDYETMGIYFNEGLNFIQIDEKWGFIDTTGKIIIEPKFDSVINFSEGLAVVKIKDKLGYIDKTGKIVIEPEYHYAYNFKSKIALVKIDNRKVICDSIADILEHIPKDESNQAVKLILQSLNEGDNAYTLLSDLLFIGWDLTYFIGKNIHYGNNDLGNGIFSLIKNYKSIKDKIHKRLQTESLNRAIDIDSALQTYEYNLNVLCYQLSSMIKSVFGSGAVQILFDLAMNMELPEGLREHFCELIAEFHNKDDFEKLLNIVKGFENKSRFINVLCKTGDERAIGYILSYLETNEKDIAWGLRYIPSRRSIEILIKILEHQIAIGAEATGKVDGTAYDGAILSLGVIGDESAIPVLKRALADSNQIQARRLAAWSLWMLEDKSGIPVMVKDGHWDDLKVMADPYIVPYVVSLLGISDEDTKISIIKLLNEIGSTDAIQTLIKFYENPEVPDSIKDYIAILLAQNGEEKGLPRICSILSDTLKQDIFRMVNWRDALYALSFIDKNETLKPVLYNLLNYIENNPGVPPLYKRIYKALAVINLILAGEKIDIKKTIGISETEILLEYPKFSKKLKKYLKPSVGEFIEILSKKPDYHESILNSLPEIFTPTDIAGIESEFTKYNFSEEIRADFYLKLAFLFQSIKDYAKEEKYARLALENAYKTNSPYWILQSLWLLADACMYNAKYTDAEKLLKEAVEICSHLSDDERHDFDIKFPDAYTYYLLGELNVKRKNYKEAIKNFESARNEINYRASIKLVEFMSQREPRDRLKAMIASGVGVCHTELGKGAFKEAVEGFEKVGVTNIREQESRDRAYYGLIRSAVADGNYEEAQRLTEKLILIKMNEDFEKMEVNPVNPERKKEMEELKKRKKEIEEMKRELEKEEKRGAAVDTIIQKKTREFKKYIHKLKTENPKLFTIVNAEPSNLKELQDMGIIPENMAILQYLLGEEELYIFIVKAYDLFIKKVSVKQTKIAGLIDEYRTLIKNRAPMDDIDEYANELYKYLIEPVESEISGVEIIGIIPNQQLYYLPFLALKKAKEKSFLGEKYKIFYINSTSLLRIVAQQEGCDIATAPLIAFANADGTLPEAEVEVKNISSLYSEILTLYQDKAVKDSVFKTSGCQILHFATHGVAVPYDPTSSYLVLAPRGEKGQLKVEEIWGLDLKDCPLVVLSACETAEGKLIAGDEVVSLAFGFIYAGSSSCLATLWEVASQSTADLMQEFHKNLKNGKSRIQALQDAQISLLKNPKTSHPFFWAPFILIGDWR
ncbi:MAG: WG repeat-containing protein [candidate division WOR-3 bacterium]